VFDSHKTSGEGKLTEEIVHSKESHYEEPTWSVCISTKFLVAVWKTEALVTNHDPDILAFLVFIAK
jgi:hypothetical protein